ncbi:IS110 family transposase [Amnibacterium kyonggiense]|uniref:Transposase n=1 Tax=Amnibacterium kyonggiense TaxID=595671 RepID=A0A4R7FGZ4_9MICO|nr:IS110 family transposase [Amnibacterium kyonggiense]TDS74900.1 transposase [Amnibacterium kyonggiense]
MATMTHPAPPVMVIGGIDTHSQTHTVAAVTTAGAMLGSATFPANRSGYGQAAAWLAGHGQVVKVGVEGTGSYGAGVTRHLQAAGLQVVEVNRPDLPTRRRVGKSDPIDAESAARAVLSGTAEATPKDTTGAVEGLRNLRVARRHAVKQQGDAARRIRSLLITAPEQLQRQLTGLTMLALARRAAGFRPDLAAAATGDVTAAVKTALASLARTWLNARDEIRAITAVTTPLVERLAPNLLALTGVGTEVAGQLLVTAGQNPHRLHSDAAFAALCGVSPIPASSGKTNRHRLNRGGDRQGNNAIWRIAITRIAHDEQTKTFIAKRVAAGDSKREAIRVLKRHLARPIYRALLLDMT